MLTAYLGRRLGQDLDWGDFMSQCEMRPECKEHFDKINDRLEKGDDDFKQQGNDIVEVKTNLANVTKSLDGVTKALWGVAGSIGLVLLGFVLWFIENKH